MIALLVVFIALSCAEETCDRLHIPDPIVFSRPGDLNLGYVAQITIGDDCDMVSWNHQYADLMAFTVAQINRDDELLPNVTLGFTVLDGCMDWEINLARVWTLLLDGCANPYADPYARDQEAKEAPGKGKLVGMVGPVYSAFSVKVSGALAIHGIPHMGIQATSDELSDKYRFEYFQRMVPPDRYQTDALLDIMEHYGWTYFSLLYTEGSYGESAAKQMTRKAAERGFCIGFRLMGSSYSSQQDYQRAVTKIASNANNRLIVTFQGGDHFAMLMQAVEDAGLLGHFIFLGGDSRCVTKATGGDATAIGMICINFPQLSLPEFTDYFINLDPFDEAASPWLPKVWEDYLGCSWDNNNNSDSNNDNNNDNSDNTNSNSSNNDNNYNPRSCHGRSLQEVGDDLAEPSNTIAKVYDAIYVFAHALHNQIEENCPEVFMNERKASDCVNTRELVTYLRGIRFEGRSGKVQFDTKGDLIGGYSVNQLVINARGKEELMEVGSWQYNESGEDHILKIQPGVVRFSMYQAAEELTSDAGVPVSVCSLPCGPREYYHYEENLCCWKCRTCRSNEYIGSNLSECLPCPQYTWPEQETALTCAEIAVTTLGSEHPLGIAILVTGAAGCLCSILVMLILLLKRNARLVKACSRELSAISLLGTLLASATAFLFVLYPSDAVCTSRRLLFHLSVSMIFTPILAKTSRVYRIFSNAKKSQQRPRFISPKAQLVITGMLLALQCVLLAVTTLVDRPRAALRMPVPTVAYVEQHCTQALWPFLVPLAFNILILMACAGLGFLTRKLPENFNESWFIFLSVAGTLLMWALMLPTYFTAFYAFLRATVLAFCLLFNVFLTLCCQYGPKMYALLLVREENIVFGTLANTTQVSQVSHVVHVNPVNPAT